MTNTIKVYIDLYFWSLYDKIKNIDSSEWTTLDNDFYLKFRAWDKGDCSEVGLIKLYLWYIASRENLDSYRDNEYKELIKMLDSHT